MKTPTEMTDDERRALPIGPMTFIDEPVTDEDRARGMRGSVKRRLVMRKTRLYGYDPDDVILWLDPETGLSYSFGQFADGTYFKRPSPL